VLERLIDHAALFPPASMQLEEALEEDRAARASDAASLIARFVVPVALVPDLPADGPGLSVVISGPVDVGGLDHDGIEAIELPLATGRPRPADLLATYRALAPMAPEIYFELVLDETWRDSVPATIGALAAMGARAKLRCGGASTPTVAQVALVIASCREAGVPFKATAGLHHALRRGDEHGFLNLLAATIAPLRSIEEVLAEEDFAALDLDEVDRSLFTSFGSCSWREPVDDLVELGLLS
jgi:hypothetical protein